MSRAYVITGASKGLGASLKELLADETCVTVGRSDSDVLMDLSRADLDVTPVRAAYSLHDEIVFVSNAGSVEPVEPVRDTTPDRLESSIRLHYLNPAKIVLDLVRSDKKFFICHMTTGAAFTANPRLAAYSASKAAMHRFIEILAEEERDNLRNLGIVNVDPGRMRTGMQQALGTPNTGRNTLDAAQDVLDFLRTRLHD